MVRVADMDQLQTEQVCDYVMPCYQAGTSLFSGKTPDEDDIRP